jgi:hypothetical protein
VTPEITPPVVRLKALLVRAKVPVALPMLVLAVPEVLTLVAPRILVVEALLPIVVVPE